MPSVPRDAAREAEDAHDVERAFMVYVGVRARRGRRSLAGRVEHLWSGNSARFDSPDELIAFIDATSRALGAPPFAGAPAPRPAGSPRRKR